MSSSIQRNIRACAFPRHRLSISTSLWKRLTEDLNRRSDGRQESGAFLLGREYGERREVTDIVYYDELDDNAYETGGITLGSDAYVPLFRYCAKHKLQVVADVHVHPGAAFQSSIDRDNPMISQVGHVALILPNFARTRKRPRVYEFGGSGWIDQTSNAFLHIGWF